jgi:mannose-1-phosphate guanylyltransferase
MFVLPICLGIGTATAKRETFPLVSSLNASIVWAIQGGWTGKYGAGEQSRYGHDQTRLARDMTARANCLRDLDVLVLAGGLGTRLRSVTGDTPKLLAPVGGQPFLFHLLHWLQTFGAHRVVFSLGYGANAIDACLRGRNPATLDVVTVVEPEPRGTAGAIRFARDELHTDPVLVLNGDTYVDADLCAFLDRHRAIGAAGTILCAEVENAGRFGQVTIERDRIVGFREKNTEAGRGTVSAGIYALSAAFLDEIAAGSARSLEHDIFEPAPAGTLAAFSGTFRFIDIGTPDSFAAAGDFFARSSPVTVDRSGLRS